MRLFIGAVALVALTACNEQGYLEAPDDGPLSGREVSDVDYYNPDTDSIIVEALVNGEWSGEPCELVVSSSTNTSFDEVEVKNLVSCLRENGAEDLGSEDQLHHIRQYLMRGFLFKNMTLSEAAERSDVIFGLIGES